MAERKAARISSLSGFIKWAAQFNDGQYLFRGASNDCYKIQASACRRLPEEERNTPARLLKITQELIENARLLGHDRKDGQRLSDLELLAQLQHYGAATCLIDFSRNALVALWMACETGTGNTHTNGKVFAVRGDNLSQFRSITPELLEERTIEFFFEERDRGYPLYQWQPKYQNNRIIAQQSIFIFGGAQVKVEADCIVLKGGKDDILASLDNVSGITEASIYPDFDGFARLYAHNKPYHKPTPQRSLQLGVEAHLEGRLDDAINYYNEVISLINPEGDLE